MLVVLGFAFVAGVLTILAPCTLPVVPLVFGAAATGGRRRTFGILAGFSLTFVLVAVVLASALAAAGLTTDGLRLASAVVLGLVGLTLVSSRIEAGAEQGLLPVARLGARLAGGRPGDGLVGDSSSAARSDSSGRHASDRSWLPSSRPLSAMARVWRPSSSRSVMSAARSSRSRSSPAGVVARVGRLAGSSAVDGFGADWAWPCS